MQTDEHELVAMSGFPTRAGVTRGHHSQGTHAKHQ
jgi:hypothetical protein